MAGGGNGENYSQKEVRDLLDGLSDETWSRLARMAAAQARRILDGDWKDLLQEALTRILEGRREWPRDVDVAPFLWNIMKSLVSDEAKARHRAKQHMDVMLASDIPRDDSDDLTDVVENHPSDAPAPDHAAYETTALESYLTDLGDPVTRDVAEWVLEGYKKEEIMRDFGLDETAYDTHTKRIRRAAARLVRQEASE